MAKETKMTTKNYMEMFEKDELIALANLDIKNGNVEEGLLKLKSLYASDDSDVEVLGMLASLYAQLGLLEKARTLYEKILKVEPKSFLTNFQLGMTYFDTGEIDQALKVWEQVLSQESVFPPALFYRGLALSQKGEIADAKQSLETLLQSAEPDNLYFEKAQELIQSINSRQGDVSNNKYAAGAYSTEH